MEKLLTISIAAYNVADYIKETLESLTHSDIVDLLEVLIIDDGGKDDTLAIASEYAIRYPKTFIPVHKKNGGYGSTVNYAVKHASGKYIKLLDGDDYFSPDGLRDFLDVCRKTDADMIFSNCSMVGFGQNQIESAKGNTLEGDYELYPYLHELHNSKISSKQAANLKLPAMWGYAFKTDIVRSSFVALPGSTLYTDQLFVVRAMANVKTVAICGTVLYNWRFGNDGQSSSTASIRRHTNDFKRVIDELLNYVDGLSNDASGYDLCRKRALHYYVSNFTWVTRLKKNIPNYLFARDWDKEIREMHPKLHADAAKISKRIWLLRKTAFLSFFISDLLPYKDSVVKTINTSK
jgi:glycosyltransferase involved in cell wall biosynthesis